MPSKKKKSTAEEETQEVDDEVEDSEPKLKERSHCITAVGVRKGEKSRKKSKSGEISGDKEAPEKQKKRKESDKVKEKKKKKKPGEDAEDFAVIEDEYEEGEQNNNEPTRNSKKKKSERPQEEVTEVAKEEKRKKKKKSSWEEADGEDEMVSKGKKKKSHDDDDESVNEEEEEEDSKKKKKKKAKKGSDDSDDDKKKKGKKSKNKQVDYAELFENELLSYHTDSSDGYDDEYYKKKVYEVVAVTGDVKGAGTDAHVFVTLYGDFGVTPKVQLASQSRSAFEKCKTDVFRIKTYNVGTLYKLRVEQDNTGMNPSWYLDRVEVTDMMRPHLRYYFTSNHWLSREEGDRQSARDIMGSLNPMSSSTSNKYIVTVFTADEKGCGTDADVFLTIFGENGDSGSRKLASDKDNFERAQEDRFSIDCPNLGKIRKISIGHNNRGSSAGWCLAKVVIDDMGNRTMYEFPVNRWFALNQGDGKIQTDVLVGSFKPMGIVYNVQVMTGDIRGAGTDSKIHIVLHGSKGMKNSGPIFLEGGDFERGLIDIFNVELCEMISPLSRVTIGHNNASVGAGWHCEKVVVFCPFTGIEQTFPCRGWLDEDVGDGLIERELCEMVSLRTKKQKKFPWSLWVFTSDIKGAGTDAEVFVQAYGIKGKSDEFKLVNKSDNFEQAQIDKFMIEMPDIGRLRKLRIWHEKRNPFSGWHLAQVTLMNVLTKEKYSFECNRWLDINEDDNEIIRDMPATGALVAEPLRLIKYRITVFTGEVTGSGTDATVSFTMFGDLGCTGERLLMNSQNTVNKFENGNADEFVFESVDLGTISRVRIGHDNSGIGAGWFLDKVLVREDGTPETTANEFPCHRWLDRTEDDGQIVRELVPVGEGLLLFHVGYHFSIKTGSVSGASSDSDVFVKLYGENGDTNKNILYVSDNSLSSYYETGQIDIFTMETFDLGLINRMVIGHTNEGLNAGWYLDSVQLTVPVHGKQYMFPAHRWLSNNDADGKVEVEIYASEVVDIEKLINYEVSVMTGSAFAAGTDAKVFCQMYGEDGKTEVIPLGSRSNDFVRGKTQLFKIEAHDVGNVYKLRLGHDGTGMAPGWFVDKVEIRRLVKALVKVEVKKEESKKDKKKKKKKKEEEVVEELRDVVKTFVFPCNRWLAQDEEDRETVVELLTEDNENLEMNSYEVHVFTGIVWGAGTDANVFISLYGEIGDTGERRLRYSDKMNKFEKGQEDVFTIASVELGVLKKLRIRHDNSQASPGWFLDRVEILDTKDDTMYYFPCKRWMAVDEEDGQLGRELVPVDEAFMKRMDEDDEDAEEADVSLGLEQKAMSTTYTIKIKTGDMKYAGTDANMFMILYGTKDDTGIIKMKASKTNKDKFEQGKTDEFIVEAVDLGPLKRVTIGHDNFGGSPGWFLDWVEIDAPCQGQKLHFPCGRWLDKKEDDGAIKRDLYPNTLQTEFYEPFVPYEIKIYTSDEFAAGTDADVSIALYGKDAICTQQKSLCVNDREKRKYFERRAMNIFVVELEDVGEIIEKIRIRHDNTGVNPGWHLDRVEVRRLLRKGKGSETLIFPCERWLAKSEEDGETVVELVPSDVITEKLLKDGSLKVSENEIDDALEIHTYSVSVITGDVFGAGTDAKVFLTMYGDLGDTGERKLSKSQTNRNKFERAAVDIFSMESVDLGLVYKILIRHDNSMMRPCWYLDQVEVVDEDTEEVFLFLCERWLSTVREDQRIERVFYVKGYDGVRESLNGKDPITAEMVKSVDSNMNKKSKKKDDVVEELTLIPYHITVCTDDEEEDSCSTSRPYVIIIGANQGQTEKMWLDLPEGKWGFECGSLEMFECYGADVGVLKMVEIGHNGATPDSCWLIDELSVAVPTKGVKYVFPCKCWLAKDRGDGLTAKLFNVMDADILYIPSKVIYEVTVVTGDMQNAGTDTKIFMTVFGAHGSTEEMLLEKNEDRFERDQQDTFIMEIDDIAPLKKMRIRIDASGCRPDWFFDKVMMRNLITEDESVFTYEEWLSTIYGPKLLTCEMAAVEEGEVMTELTTYTIQVKTSDVGAAGTDANVWIVIFGEYGDTGTLSLKQSNKSNKFERKQADTFVFDDILSLGELSKVRVWHDNKGIAPGWHLELIEVKDDVMNEAFSFPCERWLSKNDDDGQIMRELACVNHNIELSEKTKYEICVTTGDMEDAETKENAWIVLEGWKGRSKEFVMENSSKKKRFLRGSVETFEFASKNLGDIAGICLGHITKDGKKVKAEAFWHVKEVVVTEQELNNKYFFSCNSNIPLAAKKDDFRNFECTRTVESFASKVQSLVPIKYAIIIVTGDEKGAGTDANVFITIYGSTGDSGCQPLRQKCCNLFEREKTNSFHLELLDIGDLQKVRVEHDNSGVSPGWLLDRVEVTNKATGVTTIFPCGKWLDINKEDGLLVRVLFPKL
ncbi:lipoxygenase homology domain-containing protein 1 [Genypterus blacodes]|uniref:lipoxygenase homology domain-containing protein 1 n=1 Tax=Genypterus blacodes TaxID=154954 RepID=UPI003F75C22F